jgi:hypothetical protein
MAVPIAGIALKSVLTMDEDVNDDVNNLEKTINEEEC